MRLSRNIGKNEGVLRTVTETWSDDELNILKVIKQIEQHSF